jgi:hypothetical protein
MFIQPDDLHEHAKYTRQQAHAAADRRRLLKQMKAASPKRNLDGLKRIFVFIATALLPLGESISRPFSSPRRIEFGARPSVKQ